jgi:heterotetrameric sarcosine oxidase delta subunit
MLRINCPCCGLREESEFRYRGDAGMERPQADAGEGAFVTYVYDRANPKGWHLEWWRLPTGAEGAAPHARP